MEKIKESRKFVEPEVVKFEEPLDKVTLCYNRYPNECGDKTGSWCWRDWCNWWNK
jgi:hypothetical protein